MDRSMIRLCTICARSGSKGVKNKNIRIIGGKPLVAHTILQAKESNLFQYIAVSSDSKEILDLAKVWGADFTISRPSDLATDKAPKIPAIQHTVLKVEELTKVEFDIIVDLDVTSPLRDIRDIVNVVDMIEKKCVSNVITGCHSRRSPYFNLVEINNNGVVHLSKKISKDIFCRQDVPESYDLNASIYAWQRDTLLKSTTVFNEDTLLYIMPQERSIDIDTELDFQFVELLMSKRGFNYE